MSREEDHAMRLGLSALLALLVLLAVSPALAQDAQLVAVAATPSGDGVLTVPVGGVAAFAFAVLNYGAAPLSGCASAGSSYSFVKVIDVCFTDPTTGQCVGTNFPCQNFFSLAIGTARFDLAPGQIKTGTVFVQANEDVSSPMTGRITLEFAEANDLSIGLLYLLTTVAVRTP
jgi:hypothetical protein